MTADYLFVFTGPDRQPIGQPVRDYPAKFLFQMNRPESWSLTMPAHPSLAALAAPGNGMNVWRDAGSGYRLLCSGSVAKPGDTERDQDTPELAEPGSMVAFYEGDLAELAYRIVYPDYASDFTSQTQARVSYTGNAETTMRDLVNRQAGPFALGDRRVTGLALGATAGVGSNVAISFRFEQLTDALRKVALAGGGLGFRVRRVYPAGTLVFEVYETRDLSASVRYSFEIGNLRSIKYSASAPTGTVALVAGDGTGTSRAAVEVEDAAQTATWGRREIYVNNSSADLDELATAAQEALANASESATLDAVAVDNDSLVYGVDYEIGDLVSCEWRPGEMLVDVVSTVEIEYDPGVGDTVRPKIGTGNPTTRNSTLAQLRDLSQRISTIERTA